jgi:hypothetical protein
MAKLGQDDDRVQIMFGAVTRPKALSCVHGRPAEIFFRLIDRVPTPRRLNLVSFR